MGLCGGVWGIYAHGMDMTTEPAGAGGEEGPGIGVRGAVRECGFL